MELVNSSFHINHGVGMGSSWSNGSTPFEGITAMLWVLKRPQSPVALMNSNDWQVGSLAQRIAQFTLLFTGVADHWIIEELLANALLWPSVPYFRYVGTLPEIPLHSKTVQVFIRCLTNYCEYTKEQSCQRRNNGSNLHYFVKTQCE